jgi:A/G-specific adenine glycosylase
LNIKIPKFTTQLLKWHYAHNHRVMPWKGEPNPYFIWLSEIILQQTRVEQGLPYYQKFVGKYPTVESLAAAEDEDVFKLWEGLGYYSRCRNLLKTARNISQSYGGSFPASYSELLTLSGIGPYTAAAIASFAFNLPHAVLDGNVFRVLARYFGIKTPIDSSTGKKIFAEKINELLDKKNPAPFNQAIMDFGATVCKPNQPLCDRCIFAKDCIAVKTNQIGFLPVKEKKIIKTTRYFYYGILINDDNILIRQREDKDIWQNLYEFFLAESDEPRYDAADWVKSELNRVVNNNFQPIAVSSLFKQTLTHRKIEGIFVQFELKTKIAIQGYSWVSFKDAKQYAFPIFIQQFVGKNLESLLA